MTTWVSPPDSTGRNGTRPTFRGTSALSADTFAASVASADEATWARTRWEALRFALRDTQGASEAEAGRAAAILTVLSANESGYGRSEWSWNGFGMHCGGAALCTRFPSDRDDPELRAYENLGAALRDVVALVRRHMQVNEWGLLLAGDLAALVGLWRSGVFGSRSTTAAGWNSILRRVRGHLPGDLTLRELPADTDLSETGPRRVTPSTSSTGTTGTPASSPRRKRGVGALLLGLGAVAMAFWSKGK